MVDFEIFFDFITAAGRFEEHKMPIKTHMYHILAKERNPAYGFAMIQLFVNMYIYMNINIDM